MKNRIAAAICWARKSLRVLTNIPRNDDEAYARYLGIAHMGGWLVLIGLAVDLWGIWNWWNLMVDTRLISSVGTLLIGAGVWLEIRFERKAAVYSDRKVAAANARTAEALHAANVAAEDALQARAELVQLQMRATESELELARFRAPRKFTTEQSDALITALAPFAGTKVDILACGEGEMSQFVGVLKPIFHAAQWKPATFLNVGGGLSVQGVRVRVRADADETIQQASRAIIYGLADAGIETFEMHDFAPNDTPMGQLSGVSLPWVITERALIRIMIGPKT